MLVVSIFVCDITKRFHLWNTQQFKGNAMFYREDFRMVTGLPTRGIHIASSSSVPSHPLDQVIRTRMRQAPMDNGSLKYAGGGTCVSLWRAYAPHAPYSSIRGYFPRTCSEIAPRLTNFDNYSP